MKLKLLFKYCFSKKYRKQLKYEKELKKLNPKSNIVPTSRIPLKLLEFGDYSYGKPIIKSFGSLNERLKIGNYVSIAENVTFILSGGHHINTFSTFPFKAKYFNENESESLCKGAIIVEDDTWIGYGVTILSGVKIGKGAIIGAGAIVTTNLEPYGIYGGVPAKLIKYRFSKEIRERLLKINFNDIDFKKFEFDKELLYKELDEEILERIENKLKS